MNSIVPSIFNVDIKVRKNLDFELEKNMPKYWFNNDPFKTRVCDALSLTFPEGERYFISSVRHFREQIKDPILQKNVKDFIMQEAQHGIAHDIMNSVLIKQGIPVEELVDEMKYRFNYWLNNYSPEFNIALTAAAEHLTALMAQCFYAKRETLQNIDPYVRALFAWHSIEEMEHRDVAFDVMQKIAQVKYPLRAFALIHTSTAMMGLTLSRANTMLKTDGFNAKQRLSLIVKNVPWLFGKKGILSTMSKEYLDWFRPNFHPNHHPVVKQYPVWVETLEKTGNPIKAGQAFWAAGQ